MEKETIIMAKPMAMLIIAIFVTEAVKDCDPVSDILLEI
jgi:hypothetical protein